MLAVIFIFILSPIEIKSDKLKLHLDYINVFLGANNEPTKGHLFKFKNLSENITSLCLKIIIKPRSQLLIVITYYYFM